MTSARRRSRASAKSAGARFERHIADYLAAHVDDRIDRRVKTGADTPWSANLSPCDATESAPVMIRFVRHLHVAVAVKQRSRGACPARLHCYAPIRIDQQVPAEIALLRGLFGRPFNKACKVGQGVPHAIQQTW